MSPVALARQLEVRRDLAPILSELAKLPSNDEMLATALAESTRACLASPAKPRPAARRDRQRRASPSPETIRCCSSLRFSGAIEALSLLADKARGAGAVNWVPAKDQIVRHVPLLVALDGVLVPGLALESLRVGMGETTAFVRSSGGSGVGAFGQQTGIETVRVGQTVLPTTGDGQLWLNFAPHDARRFISAHRILDGTLRRRATLPGVIS